MKTSILISVILLSLNANASKLRKVVMRTRKIAPITSAAQETIDLTTCYSEEELTPVLKQMRNQITVSTKDLVTGIELNDCKDVHVTQDSIEPKTKKFRKINLSYNCVSEEGTTAFHQAEYRFLVKIPKSHKELNKNTFIMSTTVSDSVDDKEFKLRSVETMFFDGHCEAAPKSEK